MAQEPGSADANKQDIDIDDLEVEIYIIAKNVNALKQTCAFLTRRGWPTNATSNITQAIEYIAEHRPDFVLISFNHPSPAVLKLPDVVAQTFNLDCVGFIESGDAAGTARLNASKMRHKILSHASGPNIHRTLRRILADKFNIASDDKPAAGRDDSADSGNVTVRGGDKAAEKGGSQKTGPNHPRGPAYAPSGQNEGQESNSHAVASGSSSGNAGQGSAGAASGPGVIMPKGGSGTAQERGPAYMPSTSAASESATTPGMAYNPLTGNKNPNAGSSGGSLGTQIQKGGSNLAHAANQPGAPENIEEQNLPPVESGAGKSDVVSSGKYTMGKSRRRSLKELTGKKPSGAKDGDSTSTAADGKPLAAGSSADPTPGNKKADLVGMLKKSLFGEGGEPGAPEPVAEIQANDPQSILQRAANAAVSTLCREISGPTTPLDRISRVGVFPVDSEALPGYLVLTLEGLPKPTQEEFLNLCENALKSVFTSMGVLGKLEPGFWVDLPNISYASWVESASTFNFTLTHDSAEIGVSFFRSVGGLPRPQISSAPDMHMIGIDHIATNHPVNFKAYLHLKQNQKFYLYLRNGRCLLPEQKQRLKESDHNEIYMKTVDVGNLRSFLASAFLRGTIKAADEAA